MESSLDLKQAPHSVEEIERARLLSLKQKFAYASPHSPQNEDIGGRSPTDLFPTSPTAEQMPEQQQKSEYLERLKAQVDENAEQELPSVTQRREGVMNEQYVDLAEIRKRQEEAARAAKAVPPLPTMDTERDSIVDRELRWEKERGMEPEEQPQIQTHIQQQQRPLTEPSTGSIVQPQQSLLQQRQQQPSTETREQPMGYETQANTRGSNVQPQQTLLQQQQQVEKQQQQQIQQPQQQHVEQQQPSAETREQPIGYETEANTRDSNMQPQQQQQVEQQQQPSTETREEPMGYETETGTRRSNVEPQQSLQQQRHQVEQQQQQPPSKGIEADTTSSNVPLRPQQTQPRQEQQSQKDDESRSSDVQQQQQRQKEGSAGGMKEAMERLRVSNPDIFAESERPVQHRPSSFDYETEKESYSGARPDSPKLHSHHRNRNEEEEEKGSMRPSDEKKRIAELQTPGKDRHQPTSVVPEEMRKSEEKEPEIRRKDWSVEGERREKPYFEPEQDKNLQTEFKSDVGAITSDLADKSQKEKQQHKKEESSNESEKEEEEEEEEMKKQKKEREKEVERMDLQELINYLNRHKDLLEEVLGEEDRKRVRVVLEVAKDIKSLCREAVDTLKKDLAQFYSIGKAKWQHAVTEINKIGPVIEQQKKSEKSKD